MISSTIFPNVLSSDDRVDLLKLGYSGREIEDIAILLSEFQKTDLR